MKKPAGKKPAPTGLASALSPFLRRAYFDRALRCGLSALAWWAAAAALVMAWSKISPTPSAGLLAAAFGAAALGAGALAWGLGRPGLAEVARAADARLGLKERLASALYFEGHPGELQRRLLEDALQRASEHRPSEAFPLRRHGRQALAAGLCVVVAASLALTPNPQAAALARRSADQAVLAQAKRTVRVAKESLKHQAGAEAAQAERELEQALAQLERAQTPLQALTALSGLQNELSSLPDLGGQAEAVAAAAGAALLGAPGAARLSLDLSRGDLKAAAKDLRQLAKALAGLSAAQQSALAKALERAAQAAAAQQGQARPSGLGGQGPQGNGATSGLQGLASQLARAAAALAQGKAAQASSYLGSAANGASAAARAASLQQELAALQAAVRNAQAAVAAQAQADATGRGAKSASSGGRQGAGKGGAVERYATGSGPAKSAKGGALAGRGQGLGPGQGSGNGSGASRGGTGAGSGNGSARGAANGRPSGQVFVGGQPGSAEQVVGQHLANGYQVKTTNYQKVLPAFEKTALQGLGSQVISPADQSLVRDYFSSLGGAKR